MPVHYIIRKYDFHSM